MATTSAHDRYPGSAGYAAGPDTLGAALARNWWLIALRGVLGVVFGLIALLMPVATILALVLLFSAYMLVDGRLPFMRLFAPDSRGIAGASWHSKASPASLPAFLLFSGPGSPRLPSYCS